MTTPTCSCGDPAHHVIAKRQTADGRTVQFWEDSAITGALGQGFHQHAAHKAWQKAIRHQAADLLQEEVCLYDHAELPALVIAAQQVARDMLGKGFDRAWALQNMRLTFEYQRAKLAGELNHGTGQMDPSILQRHRDHIMHNRSTHPKNGRLP